MMAIQLRSGSPGVRLGRAFAASLVLHAALLAPWSRPRPTPQAPPPLLNATLMPEAPAEALATQAEPQPPAPPVRAVPPAPTSAAAERPRPLRGAALNAALAALARGEDFYPREAIARGIEGRVVLMLTLADSGAVTDAAVASSSGSPLLDTAALKAAARIGRLPGGRRQVLLPVEFRLE